MTASVTVLDPIGEAGREIARLRKMFEANEEANVADKTGLAHDARERANTEINDRISVLEGVVTTGRAVTLEGVMVQLMVANAEVDSMATNGQSVIEGSIPNHDLDDAQRRIAECERRINRAIYSAVAVLEQAARANRSDYGGDFYLSGYLDPFTALDAASEGKAAQLKAQPADRTGR